MNGCSDARSDLDALAAGLAGAVRLLAEADPQLWSSPAARLFRARLAELQHRVVVLGGVARAAHAPVASALDPGSGATGLTMTALGWAVPP